MSIRIIKPGKMPEHRIFEATCRFCTCVFEFTPNYAKLVFDQRDGDYYSIACPHCGHQCTKAAKP